MKSQSELVNSIIVVWKQPSTIPNKWTWLCSIKRKVWRLNFEFQIIFMCHRALIFIFFFFPSFCWGRVGSQHIVAWCGISVPDKGLNPGYSGKSWVLSTRPQGNSLTFFFKTFINIKTFLSSQAIWNWWTDQIW